MTYVNVGILSVNSLVNFRGSLSFGQKPLHSLPGKIGTQDVQDVQVQCFLLNVFF